MERYPHLNEVVAMLLHELRTELGMSKRQLSTLAMLERAYITGLEAGKWNVTLNALFYLCDALEIEPEEFIRRVKIGLKKFPDVYS